MKRKSRWAKLRHKIVAVTRAQAVLRLLYANRELLGKRAQALICKVANPKRECFVPADIGIKDFFARLDERNVEYVLLRWFEKLPELDPNHDFDMLVAHSSVTAMEMELSHWPVGHPVDIFSFGGGRGEGQPEPALSFRPTRRTFPDHLARRIIDNRVKFNDICYVPSPQDHFCSLAYHATYIKGAASGLGAGGQSGADAPAASHDYAAVLRALGARVGITVPPDVSRDWLDAKLTELGWRPDPEDLPNSARSGTGFDREGMIARL